MKGKTVVITGAAGGIGSALAMRFGRAGANLGLIDLSQDRLEPLARKLEQQGFGVCANSADITKPSECEDTIAEIHRKFGGIDILVNNAAITHFSRFTETDVAVFRKVMEVNLFGSIHCTKAAIDSLIERRGSIVLLSSVAGFAPLAGRIGYSASKHALHGFFESLRGELKTEGVHVMMVCPSFVAAGIGDRAIGADGQRLAPGQRTETGRLLRPEEVAEAIYMGIQKKKRLLLLSPLAKASYLLAHAAPGLYERILLRQLLK